MEWCSYGLHTIKLISSATEQKSALGHTFRFHKSVSRSVNLKFQLKEYEIFILLLYSITGISSNSINYWSI